MKIASVADIKAHFSAYLRAASRGPVVVTRNAGVCLRLTMKKSWNACFWHIRRGYVGFWMPLGNGFDPGRY